MVSLGETREGEGDEGIERERDMSKSSSLYALTIRVLSLSARRLIAPVRPVESSVQEAPIRLKRCSRYQKASLAVSSAARVGAVVEVLRMNCFLVVCGMGRWVRDEGR